MNRPIIIGITGITIIIVAWFCFRPALRSETSIQASLLTQTPLGSNMDTVRVFAQKRGWIGPAPRIDSYTIYPGHAPSVTVTAFGGLVWHDPFPYHTLVAATWEFDPSNRLYDVHVRRYEPSGP